MEAKKIQYFENVNHPVHREFIKAQSQCILCATDLEINHVADQAQSLIREEAYCPQCTLKTRAKIYQLN